MPRVPRCATILKPGGRMCSLATRTSMRRSRNPTRQIPPACAAFWKARCCRGLRTAKRNLPIGPLIREQAFGESLDPDKLERLGRYRVHLDRKFGRMLAMVLRPKDLRQGTVEG